MLVVGKICGLTCQERYLAVMVDGFTFLGSNDGPAQHSSPQTPLSSNKRTLRDLWDRTDVDGIGGPSTPTKRRLPFDEDAPSSSQVEVPETPLPSSTPGTDHSDSETDAGEEMSSIARGKQPQRRRKGRKKKGPTSWSRKRMCLCATSICLFGSGCI
jgi:hypothetical protein